MATTAIGCTTSRTDSRTRIWSSRLVDGETSVYQTALLTNAVVTVRSEFTDNLLKQTDDLSGFVRGFVLFERSGASNWSNVHPRMGDARELKV